jgi:hypothetical protein
MNTEMRNLYGNFKKRIFAYDAIMSPSPSPPHPYDNSTQMLYLISNMMSECGSDDNVLIYWPLQSDDDSMIKTCIVDRQFECTNTNNVFHIVDSRILAQNLTFTPPSLSFTPCSCSNHRQELVFDWNEFIPSDFIKTLYHHFLNHPIYSTALTSLSPTYSINLDSTQCALQQESSESFEWIMTKYLSHDRIRTATATQIAIKPLMLQNDIDQEQFDTIKV